MSFWAVHGIFFLIFACIFPRLTLLFGTNISFGLLGWLGFFFAPRFTIAAYSYWFYWDTNPILVLFAFVNAFLGETGEKTIVFSRYRR